MDDIEVVAEREVLIHDLDAQIVGLLGPADRHRLALIDDLTAFEGVDTSHPLDQGRLPCTVVPHESGDPPGAHVQVHVTQHVDGTEALVDSAQRQQGLGWISHRSSQGRRNAAVESDRKATGAGRIAARPRRSS